MIQIFIPSKRWCFPWNQHYTIHAMTWLLPDQRWGLNHFSKIVGNTLFWFICCSAPCRGKCVAVCSEQPAEIKCFRMLMYTQWNQTYTTLLHRAVWMFTAHHIQCDASLCSVCVFVYLPNHILGTNLFPEVS